MRFLGTVTLLGLVLTGCSTWGGMADRVGLGSRSSSAGDPVGAPADAMKPLPELSDDPLDDSATVALSPRPPDQIAAAPDTTATQRTAATAPAAATPVLGQTVVSLGSPSEPGMWLKTPLVKIEQQGRVTHPTTGKSSPVTLIPISGPATGGSRLSLSAMRLIGAALTDLTEVTVSLGG